MDCILPDTFKSSIIRLTHCNPNKIEILLADSLVK